MQLIGFTNLRSRVVRNNQLPQLHPHNHWKHLVYKKKQTNKQNMTLYCLAMTEVFQTVLSEPNWHCPQTAPHRVTNKSTHTFADLLVIRSPWSQLSLFIPIQETTLCSETLPRKAVLKLLTVGGNT